MSVESSKLKQVSRSGMIKEAARKVLFFFLSLRSVIPPPTQRLKVSIVRETHVRVDGWGLVNFHKPPLTLKLLLLLSPSQPAARVPLISAAANKTGPAARPRRVSRLSCCL